MLDSITTDLNDLKKTSMQSYRELEHRLVLLEAEIKVKGEDNPSENANIEMLLSEIWQYYRDIKQTNQDLLKNQNIATKLTS